MIIPVINNLTVGVPKTYLANNITSGVAAIPMRNIEGFSPSWAIQIGETGGAQSEILLLSASTLSGTIGTTTANTVYDHPTDTPVYAVEYNQAVFERSTAGTAGTAAPMTNGTVTVQASQGTTIFEDTTGSTSYAYRVYYRNSILNQTTTESDWITTSGFAFYSLGKMKQRVKDKLVSAEYVSGIQVEDLPITDWINEWMEVMVNTGIDVNEDYLMGTFSLAYAGTTQEATIPVSDFKQLRRVWYADGSGTFQSTKMDMNSFSPNKTFTDTYPYHYMVGDTILGRQPHDASGTLYCSYYQLQQPLVNDTDTLPVSMQSYTKSFIDYAHGQALFKDSKPDEAQAKLAEANAMLEVFKKQLTPRMKTGVTYIDIVEDTAADQELWT